MTGNLYESLFECLQYSSITTNLIQLLMKHADVYLFGGVARDYLDNNLDGFRDLDFVIDFKDNYNLDEILAMYNNVVIEKNRFDGYKIKIDNISIDIWELKNTWAFKKKKLKATPENLIKSVYLNLDGLVYSMNNKQFIDNCDKCYDYLKKRQEIDIVLEDNPQVELNLFRALVMKRKYEMVLSDAIKERITYYSKRTNLVEKFIDLQESHYHRTILNNLDIKKELLELTQKSS